MGCRGVVLITPLVSLLPDGGRCYLLLPSRNNHARPAGLEQLLTAASQNRQSAAAAQPASCHMQAVRECKIVPASSNMPTARHPICCCCCRVLRRSSFTPRILWTRQSCLRTPVSGTLCRRCQAARWAGNSKHHCPPLRNTSAELQHVYRLTDARPACPNEARCLCVTVCMCVFAQRAARMLTPHPTPGPRRSGLRMQRTSSCLTRWSKRCAAGQGVAQGRVQCARQPCLAHTQSIKGFLFCRTIPAEKLRFSQQTDPRCRLGG